MNLKGFFPDALRSLKEARNLVYLAALLFLSGIVVGLAFPDRFTGLLESFGDLAGSFRGRKTAVLIIMIFLQNFSSALIALWTGALLGIIPTVAAISNGILFGVILSLTGGMDPADLLVRLVPHGIFELPAVCISWGLGIWRGAWFFQRDKSRTFRERAFKAYRVFFAIVLPLLVIAAIIEGLGMALAGMGSSH
jgi:stage II sporulation protein M